MANKYQNPDRVIKNGAFLLFRMLFVLFLGFFATRLTLQTLGDEKFGIYNIVGGIVALFAIISIPVRDSLQRFFNVELAKDVLKPSVVFHTSIRIVWLMIGIITVLYETLGLYLVNNVINYPEQEHLAVNIVFQFAVLTNIFGFAQLPYIALLFSRENMGVPALCEIISAVIRIILLYLIVYVPVNILIPYSSIFLLINLWLYFFYKSYCRRRYQDYFQESSGDKSLRKEMLSFSGWSFVEAIAGVSLAYISDVFINIFGGVLYNAAYGISKQLQSAVISFTSNVVKAAEPQITSGDATQNYHYRDQLLMTTVKVSFLFIAFFYVFFRFDGEWLLTLWLGRIPQYVVEFCDLMLLSIVCSSIASPFRTLIMATGKVKWYFLTYGVVSLCATLAMFFTLKFGAPVITVMYIIFLCYAVMLIVAIGNAYKYAHISIKETLFNLFTSVLSILVAGLIYFSVRRLLPSGVIGIMLSLCISFISLLVCSYLIAFNHVERSKVKKAFIFIRNRVNNK